MTDKEDIALISVLDQAVDRAVALNISETEIVSRLLERFHYLSDRCRSAVHINQVNSHLDKKLFDGTAGP